MTAHYRYRASYLYLLRLNRTDIEAEFRRRVQHEGVLLSPDTGANSVRPPNHSADSRDIVLTIGAEHIDLSRSQGNANSFDLWAIAGGRTLEHQGNRLLLVLEEGRGALHIDLPASVTHGDPLIFRVPCGRSFARTMRLAARVNALLTGKPSTPSCAWRPTPHQLLLVRALIALDAHLAGATYREIAAAVFGDRAVRERWTRDPTLKEQTRYLLRKARALMSRATTRV